jgi:hypothetical protein
MLIRQDQLLAFQEVRLPEFEDSMVQHLKMFTPLHTASLGEAGIRTLIAAGVERARTYGFTYRGPVQFYIEMTVLLGIDFDTDPQYAQAGAILRDVSIPDQVQRADLVYEWLLGLLAVAAGPDREYAKRALARARQLPFEPRPVSSPDFAAQSIALMRDNHPEKVAFVGERALERLIARAHEEAATLGVETDAGVCLLLALMFALGHGVTRDPKYPWVAHTLTNSAVRDPEKRVERLYSKTMTYLDNVLQHIDPRR